MAFPLGWNAEAANEELIFIASKDIAEGEAFGEVFVTNTPGFFQFLSLYMVLGFTFSVPEEEECVPAPCDCLPGGAAVALEGALCDCLPGGIPAQLSRNLAPYTSCPIDSLVWDDQFRDWDRGSACWDG